MHADGCLIDGLPFQLLTSSKLALSDSLQCRLKVPASTKLNLKKQTIPSPTPKPQAKILWRVIAETLLPAARSFLPSNSPIQNRACLSNISTCCVRLIWMCKNNIPLKPSPYAYCRTIFTPFGRYRPMMRIIPCAGG